MKTDHDRIPSGDFATDTVIINGAALSNIQLEIGYVIWHRSVLRLGYVGEKESKFYESFPQSLADSGQVSSPTYNLWLDNPAGNTGMVLFGGVNTAKFIGEVHTMPILAADGDDYLPRFLLLALQCRTILTPLPLWTIYLGIHYRWSRRWRNPRNLPSGYGRRRNLQGHRCIIRWLYSNWKTQLQQERGPQYHI